HFSFAPGFAEHAIHVRGSLASATVDFERNTYVLHRHTPYGMDVDRYHMTVSEASSLARQARGTLGRVVLSKLTRSAGNPYGQSIARALQSFYAGLGHPGGPDERISPERGRDVVRICRAIADKAGIMSNAVAPPPAPTPPAATGPSPEILVLGATGFIGQELT